MMGRIFLGVGISVAGSLLTPWTVMCILLFLLGHVLLTIPYDYSHLFISETGGSETCA